MDLLARLVQRRRQPSTLGLRREPRFSRAFELGPGTEDDSADTGSSASRTAAANPRTSGAPEPGLVDTPVRPTPGATTTNRVQALAAESSVPSTKRRSPRPSVTSDVALDDPEDGPPAEADPRIVREPTDASAIADDATVLGPAPTRSDRSRDRGMDADNAGDAVAPRLRPADGRMANRIPRAGVIAPGPSTRAEMRTRAAQSAPDVVVQIGRIEVRAVAPPSRPRADPPAKPRLSLEQYLASRHGPVGS